MSIYDDDDEFEQQPSERNRILFEQFTDQTAPDPDRTGTDHVREMLSHKFTHTYRGKETIDTRKASQWLGVSQRTVQRWVKNGRMPEGTNHKRLRRSVKRTLTKEGRKAAVKRSTKRDASYATSGATIKIHGYQGPPEGPGGSYKRSRTTSVPLSGEEYQQLFDAFADKGEAGVQAFLRPHFARRYTNGWNFDTIDDLTFGDPSPY